MLVFYSLIIKRQSVISVKRLLSVSFFFFNTVVTIMVMAEAREDNNFLAPPLAMIIGLPVTKPNLKMGFVVCVAKWRADHPEGIASSVPLLFPPVF